MDNHSYTKVVCDLSWHKARDGPSALGGLQGHPCGGTGVLSRCRQVSIQSTKKAFLEAGGYGQQLTCLGQGWGRHRSWRRCSSESVGYAGGLGPGCLSPSMSTKQREHSTRTHLSLPVPCGLLGSGCCPHFRDEVADTCARSTEHSQPVSSQGC